jgi:hypothetical protein
MSKKSLRKNSKEIIEKDEKKIQKIVMEQQKFEKITNEEKLKIVKKKIDKSTSSFSEEQKIKFSENLSDIEKLKETYLNQNFKSVVEYFEKTFEVKTQKSMFSSSMSSLIDNQYESYFQVDDYPEEEFKNNEKIKIKLILSEINKTEKEKTLRRIASPFFCALDIGDARLGFVHSAISVGPWYLVFQKNFIKGMGQ